MRTTKHVVVALSLLAFPAVSQTTSHRMTDGTVVQIPDLTITGSVVACNVSYDVTRGVYRYAYTLNAPVGNLASVASFKIDLSGSTSRTQIDPGLQENIVRRTIAPQPSTTIPVGLWVPDRAQWDAAVSSGGSALFMSRDDVYDVPPNSTKTGFIIESRLPPGIRGVEIKPSDKAWIDIVDTLPDSGAEFEKPLDVRDFTIKTTTVAPADLTDADLFDGGGQQPAEVNKFLRYASPQQSRNKVPANSTFTVIVYYGKTIIPSTFTATLDRTDITSRFHPVPGGADVITISIGTSTTKLQLSVDGTKSSGGKGTDSDTLTFIPQ